MCIFGVYYRIVPAEIDERCIKNAFDVNSQIDAQSMSFDHYF